MKIFGENSYLLLAAIFKKSSILDVWLGLEYPSVT